MRAFVGEEVAGAGDGVRGKSGEAMDRQRQRLKQGGGVEAVRVAGACG